MSLEVTSLLFFRVDSFFIILVNRFEDCPPTLKWVTSALITRLEQISAEAIAAARAAKESRLVQLLLEPLL